MLTADVELLQRLKFLDYSLLVGVHRYEGEKPTVDKEVDIYALESVPEDKKEIYFMAMIDVLTFYGARKQAAHTAKTMKHGVCVPNHLLCPKLTPLCPLLPTNCLYALCPMIR
eukprot:Colp12_sorted_trinity150504_noHs@35453